MNNTAPKDIGVTKSSQIFPILVYFFFFFFSNKIKIINRLNETINLREKNCKSNNSFILEQFSMVFRANLGFF